MSKKRKSTKFKSKIGVNASWYPKYVWEIKQDLEYASKNGFGVTIICTEENEKARLANEKIRKEWDTWTKTMERAQETGQIRDMDDLLL